MTRFSARRYLVMSVRVGGGRAEELLDAAERDGEAVELVAEGKRRPGVTDVLVTVTYARGAWEVHRPGFAHGMLYNYLDDLHKVDCELCGCRHFRHGSGGGPCWGDPPERCQCGHLSLRHRYRQLRDTLDVCRAPETWFPVEERILNVLAGDL